MKWLSKSEARIVSAILAISVLLGTIPLSAGIAIAFHAKQPAFMLNICEPSQAALSVAGMTLGPSASPLRLILLEHGSFSVGPLKRLVDVSIPPELPPPKAPA
jgi:hypothetical protein